MRRILVACSVALLLVLGASPALADPAKPSNYVSQIVGGSPAATIDVSIQGGDAYFVLVAEPGTEVLVPGYDNDDDPSNWAELEVYLRIQADGTVQLNRNSEAYYVNAARLGALAPDGVGVDAEPDWETVATDGRVAWHDHRIHLMSPLPPDHVDTAADGLQRVKEYEVVLVVDGELVIAEGTLDYVRDRSPIPVVLLALLGVVGGALLARRDARVTALLALAAGGTVALLLILAGTGRPYGFALASPPIALAVVGALAPALGLLVPNLKDSQRRGLVLVGATALVLFGLLATGLLDTLLGGGEKGFGNWWQRPTLPADVAPGLLRLAIALATGLGAGLLAGTGSSDEADLAELHGLDEDPERDSGGVA